MSIEDQQYEAQARAASNAAHEASESVRKTLEERIEWLEACVLALAEFADVSRDQLLNSAKRFKR